MSATQTGTAATDGGTKTPARTPPPRAREIAQRGIETSSDLVRFGAAMIRDVLDPSADMGVKEGNLAIRAGNFTIRSAEFRRRHGEELAGTQTPEDESRIRDEALRVREAQLTAELEAIREQRSGVTVS